MSERERLAKLLEPGEHGAVILSAQEAEVIRAALLAPAPRSHGGPLLPVPVHPSVGVQMIHEERRRQVSEKGYTAEHDDGHRQGELAKVAATLAVLGTDAQVLCPEHRWGSRDNPWGLESKHRHNVVRALTIAGALITAEIDRLVRAATDGGRP